MQLYSSIASKLHYWFDRIEAKTLYLSQPFMGQHWFSKALFAVAAVLAMGFLRVALDPILDGIFPYMFGFPAVILAAWVGGWRAAGLAFVLSTFFLTFFEVPPRGALFPIDLTGAAYFISYFVASAISVSAIELLHHSRARSMLLSMQLMNELAERREAEIALAESEARFRTAQELSLDAFSILRAVRDESGRIVDFVWVYANPACARRLRLAPPFVEGRSFRELYPDRLDLFDRYAAIAETGNPQDFEVTCDVGGKESWLRNMSVKLGDGVAVYESDVTARKRSEQELRENEARFRSMADTAPAMIWVTDETGSTTFLSRAWREFTGQTEEETQGMGWTNAVHPDDQELSSRTFLKANEQQRPFAIDYRLRCRDGIYHWMIDSGQPRFGPEGEFQGFIGSVVDISSHKELEQALRLSEERFRDLFEHSPIPLWEEDWSEALAYLQELRSHHRDDASARLQENMEEIGRCMCRVRLLNANPAALKLFKAPSFEELLKNLDRLVVPESWKVFASQLLELESGRSNIGGEVTIKAFDGAEHDVIVHMRTAPGAEHSKGRVIASLTDITERKHAEQALLESEKRFRSLFEQAVIGISICTPDGRFVRVNPGFCKIVGRSEEELRKLTFYDITHPDDLDADVEQARRVIGGESDGYTMEKRYLRPDGASVWVALNLSAIRDNDGQIIYGVGVTEDITERKAADEKIRELNAQLRQRARELESANRSLEAYSSSVSHDLRTPLRAIQLYSEMLKEENLDRLNEEGRDLLEQIGLSVESAFKLVEHILSLSRLDLAQLKRESVDMTALARSSWESVTRANPGHRVQFCLNELPATCGDRVLLGQVFVNLFSNALKFTRTQERPSIECGCMNDGVTYYVKDNGVGFEPEAADQVFGAFKRFHDPKKFEGEGVGLATVQRIIERHGGRIWAEGEPNKGATFYFTLPQA